MPPSKQPPFDLAPGRSLDDPKDECVKWVSRNCFNRVAKFALRHEITITAKRARKDLGTDNQYRIAELTKCPRPELKWAPKSMQTAGQHKLLHTNEGYERKDGEPKGAIL